MKCKICKTREIETTDGRCSGCRGKVETFIYPCISSGIELKSECEGEITREDEREFYKKVFKN